MKQKAVKAANPTTNESLDLRRLELDERRVQLEEKRLQYEMRKAPSSLTKWAAIAALIISFVGIWPNAAAGMFSALLAFKGKGMEIKNQETLNERELKFKVASFLMNNWRDLNSKTTKEKRFFASLIEDALSQDESLQLLAKLEETSPPATRAIWREAKARIVSDQPSAADVALQADGKAESPAQESKAPDAFRSISGAHSTSSFLASGSITSWLNEINKPDGSGLASVSGWNSTGTAYDNYLAGPRASAVPVVFKETPGIGDYSYLNRQPSRLTSVGVQITAVPNALDDSQVTVTLTDGLLTNDPYRTKTPLYLSVTRVSNPASTINITDLLAGDGSIRSGRPSPLDIDSFERPGVMVIDARTGTLIPKAKSGADSTVRMLHTGTSLADANRGLTLDGLGYSGTGATNIKLGTASSLSAFPDMQAVNPLAASFGGAIKEKGPQIINETGKTRIQ